MWKLQTTMYKVRRASFSNSINQIARINKSVVIQRRPQRARETDGCLTGIISYQQTLNTKQTPQYLPESTSCRRLPATALLSCLAVPGLSPSPSRPSCCTEGQDGTVANLLSRIRKTSKLVAQGSVIVVRWFAAASSLGECSEQDWSLVASRKQSIVDHHATVRGSQLLDAKRFTRSIYHALPFVIMLNKSVLD